jgi:hypothetical protein
MTKLNLIQVKLQKADEWESRGHPVWVANHLCPALMSYLSMAVERFSEAPAAIDWLHQQQYGELLKRYLGTLHTLATEVDCGRLPGTIIGGNGGYLTFAHLSWLLSLFELGQAFIQFSRRPDVLELSSEFCREYSRGLYALAHGETYQPKEIRLRGQERYWAVYLPLLESASSHGDLTETLAEVERVFAERNADKRIRDDSYETEGSGLHPVQWDYRRDGVLALVEHALQYT